ncbi:MAG: four helix bundle protein [Patescibacteria group bacterium]
MAVALFSPLVLVRSKEAYALWFKALADFPKVYRYNLGGKIEGCFLELLEKIFTTTYLARDRKSDQLSLAIVKLDHLKFFLQLAWESKCLSNKSYADLSTRLDEIGRMLGGWKKGLEMKTPPR